MLSPDGHGQKTAAPSIWSFDSGYGSTSLFEEEGVLQSHMAQHEVDEVTEPILSNIYSMDYTQWNRDNPTIVPNSTTLKVFTTEFPNLENEFLLPQLPSDETCIECELWGITNPGEDVKCEQCRLPAVVKPPTACVGVETRAITPLKIPSRWEPQEARESHTPTRCSACELSALIDPSGTRVCCSCLPMSNRVLSPTSPTSKYQVRRSRAGRNSKLPLHALNRLQAWLEANREHPYPDAETKKQLAQECGITKKQVETWFTNARARQLSPLETYLTSGSEDEAADENDIASAAESTGYQIGFNYLSEVPPSGNCATSVSGSSALSGSHVRPRPSRRGRKKDFRQHNNQLNSPQDPLLLSPISPISEVSPTSPESSREMWQCTFCRESVVPKSWRRHEETIHRPKWQWTCMLYGPRLTLPRSNNGSMCAFCMAKDPSEEHFLHNHRIGDCAKRDLEDRTYFRPDHLRQHVRQFHGATLFDVVQARWKRALDGDTKKSWVCGFCQKKLDTWDERETHIQEHFKNGMTMASWVDYSSAELKADKRKGKGKEKEKDHPHGLARLSRSFTRRSSRLSQHSHQSQSQVRVTQPNNTASSELLNTVPQSLQWVDPGQVPEPDVNSYPHVTFTNFLDQQTQFANAFQSLPVSMGLGVSEAPVLPDINTDPLMGPCDGYMHWSTVPASLGPQMQYPITGTNVFDPLVESAVLQQEFDASLNLNMDLYSNPVDYQGPWNQSPQQQWDPNDSTHRR